MAVSLKSIAGKLFANDKQVVTLDTAENGGIESDSNANGNWIKYPDGTLIQYGVIDGISINDAYGSTNLFHKAGGIQKDLPISFVDDIFSISASLDSSNAWATAKVVSPSEIAVNAWYITALSSREISYIAIGRWK